jgi:hypothetical protein
VVTAMQRAVSSEVEDADRIQTMKDLSGYVKFCFYLRASESVDSFKQVVGQVGRKGTLLDLNF